LGKCSLKYLFSGEHIWRHLGTNHDAAIVVDRAYMAVATGGMTSTLRDAALFGRMALNRGVAHGNQYVPAAWVDETINLDEADQDGKPYLFGVASIYSFRWHQFF
jgi:CubicO group peptidase (beta-lactamase class C family)